MIIEIMIHSFFILTLHKKIQCNDSECFSNFGLYMHTTPLPNTYEGAYGLPKQMTKTPKITSKMQQFTFHFKDE